LYNSFERAYKNIELNSKDTTVNLGEVQMNLTTERSYPKYRTKYLKTFYSIKPLLMMIKEMAGK